MYVLLSCRDDQTKAETQFVYDEIQVVIFLCEGKTSWNMVFCTT